MQASSVSDGHWVMQEEKVCHVPCLAWPLRPLILLCLRHLYIPPFAQLTALCLLFRAGKEH